MTAHTQPEGLNNNYASNFQPTRPMAIASAIQMMTNRNARSGLVALAGGGQPAVDGATQLDYGFNEVATVASNNDSVVLPPAVKGATCLVANDGASTLAVFPFLATDTINGGVAGASVTQATTKHAAYFCYATGKWSRILSA